MCSHSTQSNLERNALQVRAMCCTCPHVLIPVLFGMPRGTMPGKWFHVSTTCVAGDVTPNRPRAASSPSLRSNLTVQAMRCHVDLLTALANTQQQHRSHIEPYPSSLHEHTVNWLLAFVCAKVVPRRHAGSAGPSAPSFRENWQAARFCVQA